MRESPDHKGKGRVMEKKKNNNNRIMRLTVTVTGRNTATSCSTMSRPACSQRVCNKTVDFNFVQSELDSCLR